MKKLLHSLFGIKKNARRQQKYMDICLLAMTILVSLALANCMLLPNEDMRYNKNAPIFFAGGTKDPNVNITIQAWSGAGPFIGWEDIGNFTSASYKWPDWGATYAYPWYGELLIGSKYWGPPNECATVGTQALVRAKVEGGNYPFGDYLFTARGLPGCYLDHPGLDFYTYCASSFPGAAWVRALDYRDFGKECAKVINEIRAAEGQNKVLVIDESGECGADDDAFCNWNWELTHDEAHHCPGPGAQNETTYKSTAPSVDYILNTSIKKKMYEDEKTCYQQNPPSTLCGELQDGCYKDPNCMCGHYVNMVVCPNYTKVSCGIYTTPDGSYKSVQNFF